MATAVMKQRMSFSLSGCVIPSQRGICTSKCSFLAEFTPSEVEGLGMTTVLAGGPGYLLQEVTRPFLDPLRDSPTTVAPVLRSVRSVSRACVLTTTRPPSMDQPMSAIGEV